MGWAQQTVNCNDGAYLLSHNWDFVLNKLLGNNRIYFGRDCYMTTWRMPKEGSKTI